MSNIYEIITNDNIEIKPQDIQSVPEKLKNKKSHGQDGTSNELLKYAGESLIQPLIKLFQEIMSQHRIPNEWRNSTTILIFKMGDKKLLSNYREIHFLRT